MAEPNHLSSLPKRRRTQSPSYGSSSEGQHGPARSRRRAPIACRMCRSRKVKCSNEKPTCSECARLGHECVYFTPPKQDTCPLENHPSLALDTLQEILKRLPPASAPCSDLQHAHLSNCIHHAPLSPTCLPVTPRLPDPSDKALTAPPTNDSFLGASPGFTSIDYVFQWPIFKESHADQFKPSSLLAADHVPRDGSREKLPSLDEDKICDLVHKFLRLVHVKNPVLEPKTLACYARSVAELGTDWDEKSCLVLVSAALGAIVKPFDPTPNTVDRFAEVSSTSIDPKARLEAEAYYQAARRRFGLLNRSLTACHCYLISGIFLLYTLRPVQAWQSFFEASSIYMVYLRARDAAAAGVPSGPDAQDTERCQLEQRLYWSCLKSEFEICAEITLPTSNLSSIDYPYLFPSPPSFNSAESILNSNAGQARQSANSTLAPDPDMISPQSYTSQDFNSLHQQSWFYYLSEIAMLRLSSRINRTFYSEGYALWSRMSLLDMVNAANDFEAQLKWWKESLPQVISCFDTPPELGTITELELSTWSRYSSLQLRLYRPFIYRLAHISEQDAHLGYIIQPLAEKAILVSLDPLFTVGLEHRHAGTWYKARDTALRCLFILCARRIGLLQKMNVEQQAVKMLELCIAHLRFWERESIDLQAAREVIELMYVVG